MNPPVAANTRNLVAACAAISVFGFAFGMTYPLLSLILESRGVSTDMIGINSAMLPIGILLISPVIPALASRYGARNVAIVAALATALAILSYKVFDVLSAWFLIRLLQGDVGSGKTVIALMAILTAVECGGQAAMMAPTEILARQHFATLEPLCRALDVRIALADRARQGQGRGKQVLLGLAEGRIPIVVGTHALFQDDVSFKDLVLSVVDEQHRFGVHQRLSLSEKGRAADVLVMTATPIPRTLLLSAYGDMDVSKLDEKPPGRQEIETRIVALDRLDEMIGGINRAIAKGGARVYWICPLVEDSEVLDVSAATERHGTLLRTIGPRVGLVHGRDQGARAGQGNGSLCRDGDIDVLVATTVVEVGVDVPEATVMVIENAERFGLAQLHQLRGRTGRGDKASTCMLLYAPPLS